MPRYGSKSFYRRRHQYGGFKRRYKPTWAKKSAKTLGYQTVNARGAYGHTAQREPIGKCSNFIVSENNTFPTGSQANNAAGVTFKLSQSAALNQFAKTYQQYKVVDMELTVYECLKGQGTDVSKFTDASGIVAVAPSKLGQDGITVTIGKAVVPTLNGANYKNVTPSTPVQCFNKAPPCAIDAFEAATGAMINSWIDSYQNNAVWSGFLISYIGALGADDVVAYSYMLKVTVLGRYRGVLGTSATEEAHGSMTQTIDISDMVKQLKANPEQKAEFIKALSMPEEDEGIED